MQTTILIADDVETNLITLRSLLLDINTNLEIIEAQDGEVVLDKVLKHEIDLIILDIQMPLLNGFQVASFLKTNNLTKDIPIIFLTAIFKDEEFINRGFKLGAVDYLTKPINEFQLTNKINLYIRLFNQIKLIKQKEKKYYQESKINSIEDILANIAHQWRQPLNSISTVASGLKMKQELNILKEPELNDNLVHIVNLTQHLSKTIDDFRTFFIKDKKKTRFEIEPIIKKALNIVELVLEEKRIQVEIICDLLTINSYENELTQVILIILNNAKDAFIKDFDNKLILISAHLINSNLIIKIKDNAGGIPSDIINNIFEPYFTTKHQSQGTGIGLYIANEIIIKHMEGSFIAKNTHFKHNNIDCFGAEFIINLPIKK